MEIPPTIEYILTLQEQVNTHRTYTVPSKMGGKVDTGTWIGYGACPGCEARPADLKAAGVGLQHGYRSRC